MQTQTSKWTPRACTTCEIPICLYAIHVSFVHAVHERGTAYCEHCKEIYILKASYMLRKFQIHSELGHVKSDTVKDIYRLSLDNVIQIYSESRETHGKFHDVSADISMST